MTSNAKTKEGVPWSGANAFMQASQQLLAGLLWANYFSRFFPLTKRNRKLSIPIQFSFRNPFLSVRKLSSHLTLPSSLRETQKKESPKKKFERSEILIFLLRTFYWPPSPYRENPFLPTFEWHRERSERKRKMSVCC